MGFRWSSCVAQSTLLGVCSLSGLTAEYILAPDKPLPNDLSLAFAVATDDLMIFSNGPENITVDMAKAVESVMEASRISKNPDNGY